MPSISSLRCCAFDSFLAADDGGEYWATMGLALEETLVFRGFRLGEGSGGGSDRASNLSTLVSRRIGCGVMNCGSSSPPLSSAMVSALNGTALEA